MPFRELKDIKKSADYQRNLKTALVAAQDAVAEFVVWQAFPFEEQTAQMIVVAPTVDASLIRKVADNGAHKLGFGQCRMAGRKLLVKPGNSIGASAITLAFKIAKITIEVEMVGRDVDLAATALGAVRQQTQAQGAPVANAAQAIALKAIATDYPKLAARMEKAVENSRDTKEQTVLNQLRRKIGSEWEDKDYVVVKTMMPAVDKAVAAIEAGIVERDKAQVAHEAKVKKLQKRYDEALAIVPATHFKKPITAWATAAQLAKKDEYTDAGKFIDAVPGLITKAEEAARAEWRERLVQEQADAESQLPDATDGEEELLTARAAAVTALIDGLDATKLEEALKAFEAAVRTLTGVRRHMVLAKSMYDQAESLWYDQKANLREKAEKRAEAAYVNAGKQLDEAKAKADPVQALKLLKNVVKAAELVAETITAELKERGTLSQKAAAANQALLSAMNLSATEDAAATSYGNGKFSSGMLNDIWKATMKAHDDNPPNGSIAGVKKLADVEAAINTWRGVAASGVLVNFHVPGGRPQAKWEKNYVRAEIQANFCVRWRGNRVNIHVDVDPKSYFDRYGDEVDWSQIPQSIRTQLGR